MPAKKKATREEVINAAFQVLRESGYLAVNARSIAKKLDCSTQPIYHEFAGMQELKQELRKKAGECYLSQVQRILDSGVCSKYTAYGLGFIQLARGEKELFRYLYMRELEEGETPYYDVDLPDTIKALCTEFGYSEDTAKKIHMDMALFCQGIALGVNIGTLHLSDEEILDKMKEVFVALSNVKQSETPGEKKKSFALAYHGGEIWCEHLDALGSEEMIVRRKFEEDLSIMKRPSTSSFLAINLDETKVSEELLDYICCRLDRLGRPLQKVVFVGLEKKMQKYIMKKESVWLVNCENDFEKAKEWLI